MRTHRRRLLRSLPALAALPAAAGRAQSAAWPAKPLRLVVGYPPGGSGDFITRVAAEELGRQPGVQVLVDNRPGSRATLPNVLVARPPAHPPPAPAAGIFARLPSSHRGLGLRP